MSAILHRKNGDKMSSAGKKAMSWHQKKAREASETPQSQHRAGNVGIDMGQLVS